MTAITTVPQPIEYTAQSKNRICDLFGLNKMGYGPNQDATSMKTATTYACSNVQTCEMTAAEEASFVKHVPIPSKLTC